MNWGARYGTTSAERAAQQPELWAMYFDDVGERHLDRQYGCFGECSYWPACGRPTVRDLSTGVANGCVVSDVSQQIDEGRAPPAT